MRDTRRVHFCRATFEEGYDVRIPEEGPFPAALTRKKEKRRSQWWQFPSPPSFLLTAMPFSAATKKQSVTTVSVWGITVLPPVFKNTPDSSTERNKNRGADGSKKEKNSFSVFSTLGLPDGRLFHQSGSRTRKFSLSLSLSSGAACTMCGKSKGV